MPCSMAHAKQGEWEGHDEREEQTREEEGEAEGTTKPERFCLQLIMGQASVRAFALHSWRSRIAHT
jgi:hypothetical protein